MPHDFRDELPAVTLLNADISDHRGLTWWSLPFQEHQKQRARLVWQLKRPDNLFIQHFELLILANNFCDFEGQSDKHVKKKEDSESHGRRYVHFGKGEPNGFLFFIRSLPLAAHYHCYDYAGLWRSKCQPNRRGPFYEIEFNLSNSYDRIGEIYHAPTSAPVILFSVLLNALTSMNCIAA